jgi:hypothetical protein
VTHWREPPRLLDVLEVLAREQVAPWVRAIYLERFRQFLGDPYWYWYYDGDLEQIAGLLGRLPEGPELARLIHHAVANHASHRSRWLAESGLESSDIEEDEKYMATCLEPPPEPTGRRARTIAALWQLAGVKC